MIMILITSRISLECSGEVLLNTSHSETHALVPDHHHHHHYCCPHHCITITISIIIIVLIIINLVFPLLLSIILIIIILNILNGKCLNDIERFPQAGMSWQCANQTGTYHPIISRCSGGREGLGGIREEPWRNDLIHVSINCRSNNHFSVQFV